MSSTTTQTFAEIDKLSLLSGEGFKVSVEDDKIIVVRQPTVKEIIDIGYSNYISFIYLIAQEPHEKALQLDDMGIDGFVISNWECFKIFFSLMPEHCILGLYFFTGLMFEPRFYTDTENNESFYLVATNEEDQIIAIEEKTFNEISRAIRQINFIKTDKPKFGNERAKKAYIRFKRSESKYSKETEGLDTIVSAVAWKGTLDILRVFDIGIYQLYDGYFRLMQIDNYENTMRGIYNGTIDIQKSKIDLKKISWASALKL